MDDLSRFCCQNPDCPDYGLRGHGNLRVGFRYGPAKQRRMLVCRTCQARFSERKGTALFASRLPEDQAVADYVSNQLSGFGLQLVRDVHDPRLQVDLLDGEAEDLPDPQPTARAEQPRDPEARRGGPGPERRSGA